MSTAVMTNDNSKPTLMSVNDTKAGMQGLDKEKIDAIIFEASKNSPFFIHQQKRQEKIDNQIKNLLERKESFTDAELQEALVEMNPRIKELKENRKDLAHLIGHLDMDMFYAAVEIRDDPSLADKPVAVGSNSMIATSNYVARKYGVRAAMAGFIGKKLCPELLIIKPNFSKYKEASNKVMAIIEEYDPQMRSASLDEAYFDLTNYVVAKFSKEYPDRDVYFTNDAGYLMFTNEVWLLAEKTLSEIRNRIKDTTKLTCSGAIAYNTMFSKVCSDLNKPDGQYILKATSPEAIDEFIKKTQVRKIPGIGPVSHQHLKALGIETCHDLYEQRALIYLLFTPASIDFYLRVSLGISSTSVEPGEKSDRKSLGAETTFKATREMDKLTKCLDELSQEVSHDLQRKKLQGRCITLRIKWDSFKSIVRNRTIPYATHDANLISRTAFELLQIELREETQLKIRLLGVRVSSFVDEVPSPSKELHNVGPAGSSIRSMFPFLGKSIKDSIIWTLTYDSGEIETNADPCDITLYEKQEPVSFAYVCLGCNSLFNSEQELVDHMTETSHSGPSEEDDVITISENAINCPICSATFDTESEVDHHIESTHP